MANPRGVWWFLGLAFGLFWGWIAIAWAAGWSLDNPLAQLPGGFAPAIAAFVVRRWVTREGFGDAGLRWRASPWWYALAWLAPIVVLAVVVGLAMVFFGYRPSGIGEVLPFALIALVVPPIFFGEEFGWRGYLQERIAARPLTAVLIVGPIWAVWHWPLAFTGYVHYDNVALGLAVWSVHTTLMAILLGWLYVRTGSVWVTSLAHGCSNMVTGVGGEILFDGTDVPEALFLVPLLIASVAVIASGRLSPRISRSARWA